MMNFFLCEPSRASNQHCPSASNALSAIPLGRKLGSHHFWIVSDGTQSGGFKRDVEELSDEGSKPERFFGSVRYGNVLALGC